MDMYNRQDLHNNAIFEMNDQQQTIHVMQLWVVLRTTHACMGILSSGCSHCCLDVRLWGYVLVVIVMHVHDDGNRLAQHNGQPNDAVSNLSLGDWE